jgi:dTMP kinase
MRSGFLKLADEFPNRFRVVNGGRDVDVVAQEIALIAEAALV